MRKLRIWLTVPLLVTLGFSSDVLAQHEHVIDPSALAAAVTQHASQQDADRAAIRETLARREVRDAAASAGIDLDSVLGAVGTLDGVQLEQTAATARQVNDALVGGQSSVTISTTMIIIALLVLILLIVALR